MIKMMLFFMIVFPIAGNCAQNVSSAEIRQTELGEDIELQLGQSIHMKQEKIRIDSRINSEAELLFNYLDRCSSDCRLRIGIPLGKIPFETVVRQWRGCRISVQELTENVQGFRTVKFRVEKQENAKPIQENFINGKKVSDEEFQSFLKTLKEIPDTWFCAKTSRGGRTGFNGKDETGNIYEYRSVSENEKQINSITSKKNGK